MEVSTADAVDVADEDLEIADEFRKTLPVDPATGERPLYVPIDTPGYRPSYYGHEGVDANLVLEGGSMRVQFTCGVLDFLSDMGFFPKNVIGVSAGALSGFNYLMGERGRTCALNIAYSDDKRYMSVWSWLHTGNAFNVGLSFKEIPFELMPYDIDEFFDSPCRLTAVASNLRTCEPEYFQIDDPIDGMSKMQASACMPFVSQTVMIDGEPYLDGGVLDTIPVDYSIETGFEKQIVVLTQDRTFEQQPNPWNDLAYVWYARYPEFARHVTNRYAHVNERRHHCMKLAEQGRIFLIMPPERISLSVLDNDPRKLYEVYDMGYAQAKAQWRDLQRYMDS